MPHPLPWHQLAAAAADPLLDRRPPHSAAQWLACGSALGLEGLVPALHEAGLIAASTDVLQAARGLAFAAEIEQAALRQVAIAALGVLAQHGIRAVPLKGALLAARLYPPPLVRRASDVDVLVAPADLDAARGALGTLGYRELPSAKNRHEQRHHHHITLAGPGGVAGAGGLPGTSGLPGTGRVAIELHFDALHGFGSVLPAAALLDGARPAAVGQGPQAWQGLLPDPTDELLLLAAHATAHNFERPLWTLDTALFARQEAIDWPRLWAQARRWRLVRPLRHALHTAARQLGDAALRAQLPPLGRADRWLDAARDRLRPMPRKTASRFAFDRLCLVAGCDNPWRAAWLGQHMGLRALGDVARRGALPVPAHWPPLPPQPPWPR